MPPTPTPSEDELLRPPEVTFVRRPVLGVFDFQYAVRPDAAGEGVLIDISHPSLPVDLCLHWEGLHATNMATAILQALKPEDET